MSNEMPHHTVGNQTNGGMELNDQMNYQIEKIIDQEIWLRNLKPIQW